MLHEGGMKGLYACVGEHMESISDLDPDTFYIESTRLDIPLSPSEKRPDEQDFIRMMDFLRSDAHDYDFLYLDSLMNYADDLVYYLKYVKKLTGYELWITFGEKMKMMMKLLVSLTKPIHPRPLHVIATWGVEVSSDWEGKRAIVPIVDGKMVGPRIDYFFDDVLMLRKRQDPETKDLQFLAFTGGTHEFDAKVSSGIVKMPPIWADPNLYKMLKKFETEDGATTNVK